MDSEFDMTENKITDEMLNTYTDTVIDHAMNPRNAGSIPNADGFACITGPCGDTMEIWLSIRDGRIRNATFWTDGCGTSIAAGSIATEMAKGMTITEAFRVTQQDILNSLGGLPEESAHCALLAANTIKGAVRDYINIHKDPWKRAYRKR